MKPEPESEKPSAMEFVKTKLSMNPEATFADIKAQAKVEGFLVYPVVYGRAKALLGLVPTAPYGSKSKARKTDRPEPITDTVELEPTTSRGSRAPGDGTRREGELSNGKASPRTVKAREHLAASSGQASDLGEMISSLKAAVHERDRYRAVLEKIAALVRAELD